MGEIQLGTKEQAGGSQLGVQWSLWDWLRGDQGQEQEQEHVLELGLGMGDDD